jgi:uncharacterized protein YciI
MWKIASRAAICAVLMWQAGASAQAPAAQPAYDAAWAKSVGANANGMRGYVFVLLTTGPKRVADGPERDAMFKGHFANMERLAADKKLVQAGPMDGVDGWRGMFVFASSDIDEVRKLVETDPVIISGEMVAQYHKYFASAGLMALNDIHQRISKK